MKKNPGEKKKEKKKRKKKKKKKTKMCECIYIWPQNEIYYLYLDSRKNTFLKKNNRVHVCIRIVRAFTESSSDSIKEPWGSERSRTFCCPRESRVNRVCAVHVHNQLKASIVTECLLQEMYKYLEDIFK